MKMSAKSVVSVLIVLIMTGMGLGTMFLYHEQSRFLGQPEVDGHVVRAWTRFKGTRRASRHVSYTYEIDGTEFEGYRENLPIEKFAKLKTGGPLPLVYLESEPSRSTVGTSEELWTRFEHLKYLAFLFFAIALGTAFKR